MVHEQLMTQKITPKNSPEQGVDLRREQKRLYFPFPFLWPSSRSSVCSGDPWCWATPRTPSAPLYSPASPCHLAQGGNEMAKRERAQNSPLSLHHICIQPETITLGNYISINSIQNCSAEPGGTIKTFSLPVRCAVLHEDWLFQANSVNTSHCFLMRQYTALYCISSGKWNLLSSPCL